jgi:Protein of unknown function (DUF2914)
MHSHGPSRCAPGSCRPPAARLSISPARLLVLALLAGGIVAERSHVLAEEGGGSRLTVPEAAICTEVKDRQPEGTGTTFPPSVGRLYCFTRVAGAADPTHVTHVWFHEDKEVHRVDLQVGGPSWRTWSYKTVPPGWTGKWRVDVQDAGGEVIYSIPFTIGEEGAPPSSAPSQ